jgi:hypothetical protein
VIRAWQRFACRLSYDIVALKLVAVGDAHAAAAPCTIHHLLNVKKGDFVSREAGLAQREAQLCNHSLFTCPGSP